MRQRVEYLVVKFLLSLASIMPKAMIYSLFRFFALIVFKVDTKRRKLTIKNLSLSFPHLAKKQVEDLAKGSFIEISKTVSEILFMINNRLDVNSVVENADEALEKLKGFNHNKGTLYVTAHFGNWEILAQFLALNGLSLSVIGRRGNNELIEDKITTPFRQMNGNRNIFKKNAIVQMIKIMKSHGRLGLLLDQKSGNKNSVRTTFFGREVNTTTSVAMLKTKYDPLLVTMFMKRAENGKYRLIINDPIDLKEGESSDEAIKNITQHCNDEIEAIVKEYPSQWFWMHNRWKL